ncbi:HK97 family phage prohead protease [Microvirga massiliensis]|uniref:HK97 family phage prohead protease n=1 Tax=Microvirga massiliensis TaxID=1033741 RepID=UPI000660D568|nr:HK97 family phage prohead protease [Microvirga massiliensis]
MGDNLVSVDEYLAARKNFVSEDGTVMKAAKGVPSWDPEKRSARFVMSTQTPDRDRDVVHQEGVDLTEFMKNPQGLLFHSSSKFPVGLWSDVSKILNGRPKRTEGTLTLHPAGGPIPEIDQAAWMLEHGGIRTVSIGFLPKSVKKREVPEEKQDTYYWPGYDILEAELIECSLVPIPAQPEAIAKAARGELKMSRDLIEEILDTWTRTGTGLVIPRAELEAAHKESSGNRTIVVVVGAEKVDAKAIEEAVAKAIKEPDANPEPQESVGSQDPAPDHPPAANDAAPGPEMTQPQARSFLRRIFDLAFGEENQARLEQELQAQRTAEAEATVAEASRKEALKTRLEALDSRLREKGLAA